MHFLALHVDPPSVVAEQHDDGIRVLVENRIDGAEHSGIHGFQLNGHLIRPLGAGDVQLVGRNVEDIAARPAWRDPIGVDERGVGKQDVGERPIGGRFRPKLQRSLEMSTQAIGNHRRGEVAPNLPDD
jgi:hypothetical protein